MKPQIRRSSLPKAFKNEQPRLVPVSDDPKYVGDYWYYGKNSPPNSHNYHFAVVCGISGHKHVQEIGEQATMKEAQRIAQNHIELRDDRRKEIAKVQRRLNADKITIQQAYEELGLTQ